ncbi:MAG: polymerase I protein [Candidatus Moranbacteria bacterium GW2011_GWC1_45_18]|nr:MAG: polymerase I protein [Candidatus Moranbacteria bacterium GW2011_GWC2_40_12]KKT31804.1 MAG: polymerase I protein [Candidatus Moranbacteria bacterium GW2011_GWF2_44_10]KKU00829.1 MAG: polymerase I protein [Candidatus Moranbacteria bacterium GW2011_GWC1_45_18]OGI36801.1 MAG: DNA polymerase I [Candidatus Moranbacteria bacterium RIFOXYC1_FULL_44_8]OGI40743.1 MAG: DNA polymerase I [Candidatus Moranbacteria bacterium RIFOXYB1_FULL_44_23]OGI41900.1 MAG: DNA polymerase I [Candidatus Moranbacter
MPSPKKKFILIDSNAIIHRAYHALPPLTTRKGEIVNAVYGFTSVLLNVLNRFKPDYIAATFDLKEPTFRHKEFKSYKATRVKAPDDLYEQIPLVKKIVEAFNIPVVEKKGYEADDLIATFARKTEKIHPDVEVIIVTGDLDTLQLVDDKVKVFALRKGMSDSVLYGEKEIFERYGLKPDQMIDYKGLRGDPSDNLPGVRGVGEKTATELLKKYNTIEEVYKNLPNIREGIRKKLEKDKLQAFFSKRLARLVENVPVDFDIEKCLAEDFSRVEVINLMRELEFFSLLRRLPGYEDHMKNLQKNDSVGPEETGKVEWKKIEAFELGETPKIISIATDSRGIAISGDSRSSNYIPRISESLKRILENEKIEKIGFDLKREWHIFDKAGINLRGISFDVQLAAYLLSSGSNLTWEDLAMQELGIMVPKDNKKTGQASLVFQEDEGQIEKICKKTAYNFALKEKLGKKLEEISRQQISEGKEKTLKELFERLEMPLAEILSRMEKVGIRINKTVLRGISAKLDQRVKKLEKEIQKVAGEDFNVNSSVQLREVLFENLKIPTKDIKKGKTGFSTASPELQKIKTLHPVVEKIEEYRELFKLKTTYLDTLPKMTDSASRIHTTFNQAVTATGRLSSSEPNLQNIPIRTDLGQIIRTAFEAEEGYRLVSADYSQIELRIAAHLSGDVRMITTFLNKEDIHTATAARIGKVEIDKVTDKMRRSAKALNFGIIYGMSTFGFSQSAGVSQEEAKEFIRKYFSNYPQVAQFLDEVKILARENGFVETELGRRRYIPEINSSNIQLRNQAERMAVNMPIQGLAADIIKLAMIEADKLIAEKYPASRMILQIHDELLFEVPEKESKRFAKDIKSAMESVYKLSVPLIADVKVGDNWGEV